MQRALAKKSTLQIARGYAKDIKAGAEGRKSLLIGIDQLVDVVAVTMGPKVGFLVEKSV